MVDDSRSRSMSVSIVVFEWVVVEGIVSGFEFNFSLQWDNVMGHCNGPHRNGHTVMGHTVMATP